MDLRADTFVPELDPGRQSSCDLLFLAARLRRWGERKRERRVGDGEKTGTGRCVQNDAGFKTPEQKQPAHTHSCTVTEINKSSVPLYLLSKS